MIKATFINKSIPMRAGLHYHHAREHVGRHGAGNVAENCILLNSLTEILGLAWELKP